MMQLEGYPAFETAMRLLEQAHYIQALQELDSLLPGIGSLEQGVVQYWKARCFISLRRWTEARKCLYSSLALLKDENSLRLPLLVQNAFLLHRSSNTVLNQSGKTRYSTCRLN